MVDTESRTLSGQELMEVMKTATYSLPLGMWFWLREEAVRRNTTASALIVKGLERLRDEDESA